MPVSLPFQTRAVGGARGRRREAPRGAAPLVVWVQSAGDTDPGRPAGASKSTYAAGSAASVFEPFGGGVQSLAEPIDDGGIDTIGPSPSACRIWAMISTSVMASRVALRGWSG